MGRVQLLRIFFGVSAERCFRINTMEYGFNIDCRIYMVDSQVIVMALQNSGDRDRV
jgi:hypothetical protein